MRADLTAPKKDFRALAEEGAVPVRRKPSQLANPRLHRVALRRPYDSHRNQDAAQEPVKRFDKRQRTLASSGEDAVNRIKEPTNAGFPLVAQRVDLDILRGPPVSSPQCLSKHKRQYPESEHSSDNFGQLSKRPRTARDGHTEHWALHECEWPKEPMEHFIARSTTSSFRRTNSNGSLNTTGGTISRETKSRPYTDKNYDTYLETKGSFMYEHDDGIDNDSAFESTCRRIQKKNETGVIRIIGELIVPSAESAVDLSRVTFSHLDVSVNEAWDSSISLDETRQLSQTLLSSQASRSSQLGKFRLPRPQPDYAAGFSRQAFTETQLKKLAPFVGDIDDTSFFLSTAFMYFSFLTAEVKCGETALDIADRQNAHSMTLSIRGVIKLFRLVKREKELHRQILAFSVSHDHRMVRIYGHYPVIDGEKTTYYRRSIREFSFAELDGREKWTSYKFVMSVYSDWAPSHLKKICSAVDELPIINFDISQQSETSHQSEILYQSELSVSEPTGPSKDVEGVDVQRSSFTSVMEETHSGLQDIPSRASIIRKSKEKPAELLKMSKKRQKTKTDTSEKGCDVS